jgi:hypothetical protein
MKKNKFFSVVALCALLLQTGCVTNLYVNFGNGTGQTISVKDTQTGQEVQIAPSKFRKVSHDQADLIVTTPDKTRYLFSGVKVVDQAIDQRYYDHSTGLFGTWHIDLNVLLQTNMDLYVLLPGMKAVDASVPQPDGYPKGGKKTTN